MSMVERLNNIQFEINLINLEIDEHLTKQPETVTAAQLERRKLILTAILRQVQQIKEVMNRDFLEPLG
jgi:hypothetical protein